MDENRGKIISCDPQLSPAASRSFQEAFFAAVVLLVAGFLAYGNSFHGRFIFDDGLVVRSMQSNSPGEYLFSPGGLARPVVSFTLALNYVLGGVEVAGYHLFNLAVHLLASLVLFAIIRRTLRLEALRERFDPAAGWLALAIALLWLVHPLQTESVTYIWQRCESLAGLFYLLTLYCVLRGAETPVNPRAAIALPGEAAVAQVLRPQPCPARMVQPEFWYALAILACFAGMSCKLTLVTAPVVVFVYDCIFLSGRAGAAWRERRGLYLGLAASWLLLAAFIFLSPPNTIANFKSPPLSPAEYARTQFGVILHYLRLSFWPVGLCLDYLWPPASRPKEILPGAVVVGVLVYATCWAWFRRRAWSFLGIWFFFILAPTSSFVPFLEDLAFEHRMYLPLAAVIALVLIGGYLLGGAFLRRLPLPETLRLKVGKPAATVLVAVAAVLLGYLTYKRNADYHEPLAMWEDVLSKRPKNWRAYNNAGYELIAQGKYEQAIRYFTTALRLNPRNEAAHGNRGNARLAQGDCVGAIEDCDNALKLNPRYAQAYYIRGNARLTKGDRAGAVSDYTSALEMNSRYIEAYGNRGVAFLEKGDFDGALADFDRALELNPQYAEAFSNRGAARGGKGDFAGALADCNKAVELDPSYPKAYSNRGLARLMLGDYSGAEADFSKAVELEPSNWQFWSNKGLLFVRLGKEAEAEACFAKCLKIKPDLRDFLAARIAQVRAERRQEPSRAPEGK